MNFPESTATVAIICDWKGTTRVVSCKDSQHLIGSRLSEGVQTQYRDELANKISMVISSHCQDEMIVVNQDNRCYKVWMWPLGDPDMAASILCSPLPLETKEIGPREARYLQVAAEGATAKEVAERMGVNLNTVHVQFRSMREKLNLNSNSQLMCFAARYFYTPDRKSS